MLRALLVASLLVVAAGCSCSQSATLTVDLVTDLAPGIEVFSARTSLRAEEAGEAPALTTTTALRRGTETLDGVRVAEFFSLAPGRYRARVELLDLRGAPLVEQRVDVLVRGTFAIQVVVTRDCIALVCPGTEDPPDATECRAGRCEAPACEGAACVTRECETDGDCPVPGVSCAVAECREGVCLAVEVAGTCDDGFGCDPDEGCVVVPDVPDVGSGDVDAGGTTSGDLDGDGVAPPADCDEGSTTRYTGAPEACGDAIDQDCDGIDLPCPPDGDMDGFGADEDCDDTSAAIGPGAEEICGNAIDEDCDLFDLPCPGSPGYADVDGDEWPAPVDCDDANPLIHPYALEICGDRIDQDCSGADRPAPCRGAYLQQCLPGPDCLDAPREHLACVDGVCGRCCVLCENRRRYHWVNVDHDCRRSAMRYCAINDRGGVSDDVEDPIQWGGCNR